LNTDAAAGEHSLRRRFRGALLIPVAAVALLLAGCASISKPDGWAPPTITNETLYVSLNGGEMSALDVQSFAEQWVFPPEGEFACGNEEPKERDLEGIYGQPLVTGDTVYIGAYDGSAYALDRADGACLWTFQTDDPIVAGLVMEGDRLYVPSTDGHLYVLDPATGEEVQRVSVGDIWATPLLTDEGELYVTTMEGELWKFTTGPLEPSWTPPFQVSAGLLTAPTLAGDTVVVGGIGRTLFGVDSQTGEQRWSMEADNWFWGDPAVHDEDGAQEPAVYATNLAGQVFRVDTATGETAWEADAQRPVRSGAVVAGEVLVVVNDAGLVTTLDPDDGTVLDTIELDASVHATPLVTDSGVLVVARNGSLFSIDVESGRVTEVID
jgi:outer membrane protein assembly factor BamB